MINRTIASILEHAATLNRADARIYVLGCAGFPLAFFVHFVSMCVFFHLGYIPLAIWEIGATLLWLLAWLVLMLRWDVLRAAFTLVGLIEIPLRAALATYYTGSETGFWLYILVSLSIIPLIGFYAPRTKLILTAILAVALVATVSLPAVFPPVVAVSSGWQTFFVISNVFSVGTILIVLLFLFDRAVRDAEAGLEREHARAEGLLKNILPDPIALRLKDGEKLIADDHPEVSVIFADIVNFTEASARMRPADLVQTLNLVFSEFDRLTARHKAEKIKTVGDAYMAVVGLPKPNANHANVAVTLALDMLASAHRISTQTHFPIDLRIGVNSGPVVAGVIGTSKFAYDLWGDAVNVASRMESHSEPGKVLITQDTSKLLGRQFAVTPEGYRAVKGKGTLPVFSVRAA